MRSRLVLALAGFLGGTVLMYYKPPFEIMLGSILSLVLVAWLFDYIEYTQQ